MSDEVTAAIVGATITGVFTVIAALIPTWGKGQRIIAVVACFIFMIAVFIPIWKDNDSALSQDVYAILYESGTMVFQQGKQPDHQTFGTYRQIYQINMEDGYSYDHAQQKPSTPWYSERENIRKVVFADVIKPKSTAYWFRHCDNLTEIEGISRLDTSKNVNMNRMFSFCGKLTELDISGFHTGKTTDMSGMFANCSSLVTIYSSRHFVTTRVSNDEYMFAGCKQIRGGNGTTYNSEHTDAEYARIDGGLSNPGYFTAKG